MKRARQIALAQRIHRIQEANATRLERVLTIFFREQAGRVVARYLEEYKVGVSSRPWYSYGGLSIENYRSLELKSAILDGLFPDEEFHLLRVLIMRYLTATMTQVGDLASEMVGLEPLPPTDPHLIALLAKAGNLIRRITEETRSSVQDTLTLAASRGYSDYQTANGVPADSFRGIRAVVTETYKGRAATIARTETAVASNLASTDRYLAGGVTIVDVYDGEGCGWDGHDDPDEANGSVRTIEDAEAQPISHPNCRRVFFPILDSRSA